MSTTTSVDQLRERLEAIGQDHLLAFHDELEPAALRSLLDQIASIDLERVPGWVETYVLGKPCVAFDPAAVQPAPCYSSDPCRHTGDPWDRHEMKSRGEALIRAGKVAAFTVAGGQGTRLGYDGPKGTFPATPVTRKPLFAVLAEQLLAAGRKYGVSIPWAIMTSPLNHEDTVRFFATHHYFGLNPDDVWFFTQGILPSFDMKTGKILLASRHEVATNPDGHGGSLKALWTSGTLRAMQQRGIEHISYVQIDNPLARMIDPVFIGLHAHSTGSSAQMSSKMVAKIDPAERVGVFCAVNGKTQVIEYSDLPAELAEARDESGNIRFNAGSIAIHLISVEFVASLNSCATGFALPLHRAEKKVPYLDLATGRAVSPESPNAVKLETFVFDALPLCDRSLVYETPRSEEFAPIKNAQGNDSPQTSAALQSARAADWLERAGVKIPRRPDGSPDCVIELSPLTALEPEDLDECQGLPISINPGTAIAL
jgi:UDP-N-acetylglucosamine/UDP-N-acetylgalactosamine diphosphorylase